MILPILILCTDVGAGGYRNCDILLYRCLHARFCGVAMMMNHLVIQATSEALHGRILITLPLKWHGSLHAEVPYQFPVILSVVLRPAVRVVDPAKSRTLTAHGVP